MLAGESAGSKLEKAQKLGVRIMDETEFLSLVSGEAEKQEKQPKNPPAMEPQQMSLLDL